MALTTTHINGPRPVRVAMILPPKPYLDGVPRRMCDALVDGLIRDGQRVTTVPVGGSLPAGAFDLVHVHRAGDAGAVGGGRTPVVWTVHGDPTGVVRGAVLVAVSAVQRRWWPDVRWDRVVHHGVEATGPVRRRPAGPALWSGRMRPEHGADLAVAAARTAGRSLILAGSSTGPAEQGYYRTVIVPLLGPDVRVVPDPTGHRRPRLLAAAACLLVPGRHPEPSGIALLDAMAAGVPVVTTTTGPAPELVVHEHTGLLCHDVVDLPAALLAVRAIDPGACVRHIRERFSVAAMTRRYVELYRRVCRDRGIDSQATTRSPWPFNG